MIGPLQQRRLTLSDIPAAIRLSTEPGWNQVAADWQLMIEHGDSFGRFTEDGRLVASGLTVPFSGLFGWISMILVTAEFRRRGFATQLMRCCIDALLTKGIVPALDATPEGRQVYLPLGFRDVYHVTRYFATQPGAVARPRLGGATVRPMRKPDLEAVDAYDATTFGADRGYMLRHLLERMPAMAQVAEQGGRICGYVLGRDGRTSSQIGPLVADDSATAIVLLQEALAVLEGAVCIDVGDFHREVIDVLGTAGFLPQFPFIRMIHGRSEPFDDPRRIVAIAGPELG
jgi:GNAT superfamily N-acetyltransferase